MSATTAPNRREKLAALLAQVRPGRKVTSALRTKIGDAAAPMLETYIGLPEIAAHIGTSRARAWQISNIALGTLLVCLYLRLVARVPPEQATPKAACLASGHKPREGK